MTLQLLLREFANDVAVPGVDSDNFNDAATDQSVDISVSNRAALVLLSTSTSFWRRAAKPGRREQPPKTWMFSVTSLRCAQPGRHLAREMSLLKYKVVVAEAD